MKKLKLDLSPAEYEIMRVVWEQQAPLTVRDVINVAYPNGEKAYTTVQTFMNIMVDKGMLTRKKVGPVNVYTESISKENFFKRSLSTVAHHLFDGSFGDMASYLVSKSTLTTDEIEELRALLKNKKGGKS